MSDVGHNSIETLAAHSGYGTALLETVDTWPDGEATWDRCAPLLLRQVRYLAGTLGMPAMALQRDGDGIGWPLVRSVVGQVSSDRKRQACDTFDWRVGPDGGGTGVIVTVARDAAGNAADHVAIDLRTGWVGTEGGGVAMLGEHEIREDMRDDDLTVHRTAAEWLRAGRRGVVMLDRRRALPMLREAGALVVADTGWGRELDRMLRVRGPQISVAAAL